MIGARTPSVLRRQLRANLYRVGAGGCPNAAAAIRRLESAGLEVFEAVGACFDGTASIDEEHAQPFVCLFLEAEQDPACMHAERLRLLAWAIDRAGLE